MASNCFDQTNSQAQVLARERFSIADVVALRAVDRREMKILGHDVAWPHQEAPASTRSDFSEAEGSPVSPGAATHAIGRLAVMLTSI